MSKKFRAEYRKLTANEEASIKQIKLLAGKLDDMYERILQKRGVYSAINADPRSLQFGMTKLEESVMWAVKAITEP